MKIAFLVSLISLSSFAGPLVSSGGVRGSLASCQGEVSGKAASLEIFPSASRIASGALISETGAAVSLNCVQSTDVPDASVIECMEQMNPNELRNKLIKIELTTGFSGIPMAQVFVVSQKGSKLIGQLVCQQ